MRQITHEMLQHLSWSFQVGDRSPTCVIQLRHPETKEMMTVDRIVSIDLDRRADSPAHEFSFVADNSGGWLSPDYKRFGGIFDFNQNRGYPEGNPWVGVFMPNTRVEIHLGYGDELMRVFTGLIDNVQINSQTNVITVKGRCVYKRLLVETVKPAPKQAKIVYKNQTIKYIVDDIFKRLNIPMYSTDIPILGGSDPYIVPQLEMERGNSWDSFINPLVKSAFAYIGTDHMGAGVLKPIPKYSQSDPEHVVIDQAVNLTQAEYNIDDMDIKTDLIIKYSDKVFTHFKSSSLTNLCRGQYREEVIEVPWADTLIKRQQAASSYFYMYHQKFRTLTMGTIGNPALELFDLARIYDQTSQATGKYIIKGIRTTFSEQGYFDILDCEVV